MKPQKHFGNGIVVFLVNLALLAVVWKLDRHFIGIVSQDVDKDTGMTGGFPFVEALKGFHYWLVTQLPIILVGLAYNVFWFRQLLRSETQGRWKVWTLAGIVGLCWAISLTVFSETPLGVVFVLGYLHIL